MEATSRVTAGTGARVLMLTTFRSNGEIARDLFVSETTLKTHVAGSAPSSGCDPGRRYQVSVTG